MQKHNGIKKMLITALFIVAMMSATLLTVNGSDINQVKTMSPSTVILMGKPLDKFSGKHDLTTLSKYLCKRTGLTHESHKLMHEIQQITHHCLNL